MLNDRLANDVRRNGTHSSGTDDDRALGFVHVCYLLTDVLGCNCDCYLLSFFFLWVYGLYCGFY